MATTPDYLKDYREAQAAGHHEDCDGWMTVHRTEIRRNEYGTFECWCEECGKLHIGSAGSRETAESFGKGHAQAARCDGRCKHWD